MSRGEGEDARPNNEDEKYGRGDYAQNDVVLRNVGGGKERSGSVELTPKRLPCRIEYPKILYCSLSLA